MIFNYIDYLFCVCNIYMDKVKPSRYEIKQKKERDRLLDIQISLNNNAHQKRLLYSNEITPDQYMEGDYADDDTNQIRKQELLQANINKLVKKATTRSELKRLITENEMDEYFNDNFPRIYSEITKNYGSSKNANELVDIILTMKADVENEAYKNPLSASTFQQEMEKLIEVLGKSNTSKAVNDIYNKLSALNVTMESLDDGLRRDFYYRLHSQGIVDGVSVVSEKLADGTPIKKSDISMSQSSIDNILNSINSVDSNSNSPIWKTSEPVPIALPTSPAPPTKKEKKPKRTKEEVAADKKLRQEQMIANQNAKEQKKEEKRIAYNKRKEQKIRDAEQKIRDAEQKIRDAEQRRRDAIEIDDDWDPREYIRLKADYVTWCSNNQGRSINKIRNDPNTNLNHALVKDKYNPN
jgi:hypothetical protein